MDENTEQKSNSFVNLYQNCSWITCINMFFIFIISTVGIYVTNYLNQINFYIEHLFGDINEIQKMLNLSIFPNTNTMLKILKNICMHQNLTNNDICNLHS
jgi:hypothetical protein